MYVDHDTQPPRQKHPGHRKTLILGITRRVVGYFSTCVVGANRTHKLATIGNPRRKPLRESEAWVEDLFNLLDSLQML